MLQATLPVSLPVLSESETPPPDRPAPIAAQVVPKPLLGNAARELIDRLLSEGMSCKAVADRLNELQFCRRRGKPWYRESVYQLASKALRSRVVRVHRSGRFADLTPELIARRAAAIRAGWSPAERRQRGDVGDYWTPPTVSLCGLVAAA